MTGVGDSDPFDIPIPSRNREASDPQSRNWDGP